MRVGSIAAHPTSQEAIAYAWLLNDAAAHIVAAGADDDAPQDRSDSRLLRRVAANAWR
ncbi:hypothetical protein [Burkholderia catarinensis]|uniref:hypothetical protein n=1 Tax=Burkholderia catarinensis TaxID=1108140 RepID=UPI001C55ECBA|nr:hypothetical protein [Burkholderia catarinensis]